MFDKELELARWRVWPLIDGADDIWWAEEEAELSWEPLVTIVCTWVSLLLTDPGLCAKLGPKPGNVGQTPGTGLCTNG